MSLILVDTSIWIDVFGKKPKITFNSEDLLRMAVCPPVIQEVLQGVRDDLTHKKLSRSFLALPCFESNLRLELFLEAADIYRSGRRRGLTIRSSIDCLISAIAIKNNVPIWHRDRDYTVIAKFTDLKLFDG